MQSTRTIYKILKERKLKYDLVKKSSDRSISLEQRLLKENTDLKNDLYQKFNGNRVILENINSISKSIANIQIAIMNTEDGYLKQQYFSSIRSLVSKIKPDTQVSDFAFLLKNSYILQKSGLSVVVSGIDVLKLLSKGYSLIDTDNDCRVKMIGSDIVFRYPSIGIGNKHSIVDRSPLPINDIISRKYIVDINGFDHINEIDSNIHDFFCSLDSHISRLELANEIIYFYYNNGIVYEVTVFEDEIFQFEKDILTSDFNKMGFVESKKNILELVSFILDGNINFLKRENYDR